MRNLKKVISIFLSTLFIVLLFSNNSFGTSENSLSSTDFLNSVAECISLYDTPLYQIESIEDYVPERRRIIVKTITNDVLEDDMGAIEKIEGWNNIHILQYYSTDEADAAYNYFSIQSNVEFVEYDLYLSQEENIGNETLDEIDEPLSWGNNAVNSDSANEMLLNSNINLEEITVAVFDTGLGSNHPYFDSERILDGCNVWDPNGDTLDNVGHGTHVSGIIYNNTLPNVKIKPYKLNKYNKYTYDVSFSILGSAIISAVDEGVDVINISMSFSPIASSFVESAFEYAFEEDVSVVVAAGNDKDGDGLCADDLYPACSENVITVSAVDSDFSPMIKSKNGFGSTNYGKCVDISAPGEEIKSTYSIGEVNSFVTMSGTSMATPFVSAAIATLKSVKPSLSSSEIVSKIKASVFTPKDWNNENYGTGIIDFEKMLSDITAIKPTLQFTGDGRVKVIATPENAKVYYTTDGTEPIVGISRLYSEPITTEGATEIRAISYEEGKIPSKSAILKMVLEEGLVIRYKGKEKLEFPYGSRIEKIYSSNDNIVSVNNNGEIVGKSVGEATITAQLTNNQKSIFHVKVEYVWWQQLIIIFLLGFLWY